MHLKKMYAEFTSPPHPLLDAEKEERLYNILPLFTKVFANAEPKTARDKFPESAALAQSCGRLLVTEVRRRASNQSTEEAAAAIAAFMEVGEAGDEFEGSNGWMLLTSLKILSSEGDDLVDVMTGASVPSTLVKCLYLFFDLPKLPESEAEGGDSKAVTKREHRQWLQKLLARLLMRLCRLAKDSFQYSTHWL